MTQMCLAGILADMYWGMLEGRLAITWVLAHLKLLVYGLLALLLLTTVWTVNRWRIKAGELDQAKKELSSCYDNQRITKELSIEYQRKIGSIERRLAESKRLRPEVCVPVSNSPRSIVRADSAGLSGPYGISSWSLIDFAGDAQKVNERAALCKSFLEKFSD